MTVTIMEHTFNDDTIRSCIIGEHGKAPWDFEFVVPALAAYSFLQDCIYKPAVINNEHLFRGNESGLVTYDSANIKSNYIVTKIEYNTDDTEDVYIISGIEEAAYILTNNIAYNDTKYNNESFAEYLKRIFETFTSAKWEVKGGEYVDFKPIMRGEFLSDWFWSNAKEEEELVDFKKLGPNSYSVRFYKKNKEPKLLNKFLSAKRVKENLFNNAYVKGNDLILTKADPEKNKLFYNTVFAGSYPARSFKFSFPGFPDNVSIYINDLRDLILTVLRPLDYDFQVQFFFTETTSHYPGWIMLFPVAGGYYQRPINFRPGIIMPKNIGQQIKCCTLVTDGADGSAHIENITEGSYNPKTGEMDYGSALHVNWYDYSSRLSNWPIGQSITGFELAHLTEGGFERSFQIPKIWYDLFAAYGVNSSISFPQNKFKSDFELNEKQQSSIFVGDEVVSLYGDDAICTDKVISYESGAIKYDVTIKDPIELKRE